MSNLAHQATDDLQPKIQSMIGILSFIVEYFEANNVELPNMRFGALEDSLKGVINTLTGIESDIEVAFEFKQLIKKDIEFASDGHLPIKSLSSSKIIDMYLDNDQTNSDLTTKIANNAKIRKLMQQNRNERRNRLKSVDDNKNNA
jgi:hypothetical protein